LLRPGSVQWMTAGSGIVHSEMPEQEDGLMWGFQLWVNLPAAAKMTAPRYQEFEPDQVPVAELPGGVKVRVIAGEVGNVTGPVSGIVTAPTYLDVELPAGASASFELPLG
jgi:quercetin 2,3-dioxygenase